MVPVVPPSEPWEFASVSADRAFQGSRFPEAIKRLEPYSGRFEAFRLTGQGCDAYFASYPAGTEIEPHHHDTDNHGLVTLGELILIMDGEETRVPAGSWYHVPAGRTHAARFEEDTEEIELWFAE